MSITTSLSGGGGGGGAAAQTVIGPAVGTATDNAIVRWDGTTGALVQNSVVTVADTTGEMQWVGNDVSIRTGSGNQSINLRSEGTGATTFSNGVNLQATMDASGTLSQAGANGYKLIGVVGADGKTPSLLPDKADADTGIGHGPSADQLSLVAGGVEAVRANTVASGVNYLSVTPGASNTGPTIAAAGTGSNLGLFLTPSGSGVVTIGGSVPTVTSPTNTNMYLNAASSKSLWLQVGQSNYAGIHLGSDVVVAGDITFGFSPTSHGSGDLNYSDTRAWRDAQGAWGFRDGANAHVLRVYRTYTDASNYERAAVQTGAGYVELAAETAGTGTDDIDLRLTPAGAGVVRFGTHTGVAAELVTGYITIKDAAGNSRKLAVIS